MPISLEAPAKLNLSLRVVGRRADGYHLLASELVLLELADRLLLMPGAPGLRVERVPELAGVGGEIPVDRTNLAWRGLVAGLDGEPQQICLALEKRIPAGAGLGGGSSDAAAGWRLGRRAAGLSESASMADLGLLAEIGADIPFFAAACVAARVGGIGEQVTPVEPPDPRPHVVLVTPAFGLSTAAVFAELRPRDIGDPETDDRRNDLLAPALRLRPELQEVLDAVARAGADPHLTGSGSTIFALDADAERLAAVAARLRDAGLRIIETRVRAHAAAVVETTSEAAQPASDAGASSSGVG